MTNPIDEKFLAPVLKEYGESLDRLTQKECEDIGIPAEAARVLVDVLESERGIIREEQQSRLKDVGFTSDFVKGLAGEDGKSALHARVRWLGENAAKRWWRWDYSAEKREAMLIELGALGTEAKGAVPSLIDNVTDWLDAESVRASAAITLGRIGVEAKGAIPALIESLGSSSSQVRYAGVLALGGVGSENKAATAAFIRALKDSVAYVRDQAAYSLGWVKPDIETVVPILAKNLESSDPKLHESSALALAILVPESSETKAAIQVLIKDLKNPEARVRWRAAHAIGEIARKEVQAAAAAVPALIEAYSKDSNPEVRFWAISALSEIGAEAAIPTFFEALEDAQLHYIIVDAINQIRPKTQVLVPLLSKALIAPNPTIRIGAARIIARFQGPESLATPEVVTELRHALTDPNPQLHTFAAETLIQFAAEGLIQMEPKEVSRLVTILTGDLESSDENVQRSAIHVLGEIGPQAKEAIPALIQVYKETRLKRQAAEALAKIGPETREAIPALIEALGSWYPELRLKAAQALSHMGKIAVPALIVNLRNPDPQVRSLIIYTLGQMDSEGKEAIPALIKDLLFGIQTFCTREGD